MNGLIKKEIKFNGNKLLAILENDRVYVSVKHVCIGLEMSEHQYKAQKLKVNKDGTLKGGIKLYPLDTNGGTQQTLMIELDYLPLWLAKINPSRFDDELKERLLNYQLRCKDILSDAFFGERKTIGMRHNPALNDIEDRTHRLREIEDMLMDLEDERHYHYNWISSRAWNQREEAQEHIKRRKETHFELEGKKLTMEDIDELNRK